MLDVVHVRTAWDVQIAVLELTEKKVQIGRTPQLEL